MSAKTTPKVTLADAMLAGHTEAFGLFADLMRAKGYTYAQSYEAVRAVFVKVGRMPPSAAEFDRLMYDYEEGC
jgi:hypothetical protein